jgi:hypothetical protein
MSAPTFIYPPASTGGTPVGGSGTAGTIPVWSTGTTLGDSGITDNGSTITISRLTVVNNVNGFRVTDGGATNIGRISQSGAISIFDALAPSGTLLLRTNAGTVNAIFASAAGNVGIGTASPNARLEVRTATSGAQQIRVSNTADANSYWDIGRDNVTTGALVFRSITTECMRVAAAATPADSQVAIGTTSFTSGRALTTVQDLDVYGVRVGRGAGAVSSNTAVGSLALDSNSTGTDNVAVGTNALRYTTGNSNTAVGFGSMAGASGLSTHADNVSIGFQSLAVVRSGSQNMASGAYALGLLQSGAQNVGIGFATLYAMVSTGGNTAIGHESGRYVAGGGQVTQATDGVFLGRDARPNVDAGTNEVVIGAAARGNGSNTVTIGNSSNVGTFFDTQYIRLVDSYTVGALPAAGTAGRIARVTDGDAALAWGATVVNTGAGATPYLVWDNGTNWTVFGK